MTATPLLQVTSLTVSFPVAERRVAPVDDICFTIHAGESVAMVGESGSGKSTLALSLMRLLPRMRGLRIDGRVEFDGEDVYAMSPGQLSAYRGGGAALIPQDPMTSLNPTLTVGRQLRETLALDESDADVHTRALEKLRAVRIPEPEARLGAWPHQLSGGLRQRVVGAIGIARNPRLLIADEPTTALDVTVQRRYIDMLRDLVRERAMAMLFITHDLGVAAHIAQRIIVLYAGEIVEDGPVSHILTNPRHWYTAALVASARGVTGAGARLPAIPGHPPSLTARPEGCRFAPRCLNAQAGCEVHPTLEATSGDSRLRCHFPRGGD
jgi:oligopeptide/dipeptide ABC transporter ATP-binding protein